MASLAPLTTASVDSAGMIGDKEVEELLSEKLLEGYSLLDTACPKCVTPLVTKMGTSMSLSPRKKALCMNTSGPHMSVSYVNVQLQPSSSDFGAAPSSFDAQQRPLEPIPNVPYCVSCQAHVVTKEADLQTLESANAMKDRGSIIVAMSEEERDVASPRRGLAERNIFSEERDSPEKDEIVVEEVNPDGDERSDKENLVEEETVSVAVDKFSVDERSPEEENPAMEEESPIQEEAPVDSDDVVAPPSNDEDTNSLVDDDAALAAAYKEISSSTAAAVAKKGPASPSVAALFCGGMESYQYVAPSPVATPVASFISEEGIECDLEEHVHQMENDVSEAALSALLPPKPTGSSHLLAEDEEKELDEERAAMSPRAVKEAETKETVEESESTEEVLQEYSVRRDIATKILGAKMLQGYSLMETQCLKCGMPLMENAGQVDCVVCPVLVKKAKKKAKEQEEARLLAEKKAKIEAEIAAKKKAEEEALAEAARIKAEQEAKAQADIAAKKKAEEAEALVEAARIKAEEDAKVQAEIAAKKKAEEEALAEAARIKAEQEALEAMAKAEEEEVLEEAEQILTEKKELSIQPDQEAEEQTDLIDRVTSPGSIGDNSLLSFGKVTEYKSSFEEATRKEEEARLAEEELLFSDTEPSLLAIDAISKEEEAATLAALQASREGECDPTEEVRVAGEDDIASEGIISSDSLLTMDATSDEEMEAMDALQTEAESEFAATEDLQGDNEANENDGHPALKALESAEEDKRAALEALHFAEEEERLAIKLMKSAEQQEQSAEEARLAAEKEEQRALEALRLAELEEKAAMEAQGEESCQEESICIAEEEELAALQLLRAAEEEEKAAIAALRAAEEEERLAVIALRAEKKKQEAQEALKAAQEEEARALESLKEEERRKEEEAQRKAKEAEALKAEQEQRKAEEAEALKAEQERARLAEIEQAETEKAEQARARIAEIKKAEKARLESDEEAAKEAEAREARLLEQLEREASEKTREAEKAMLTAQAALNEVSIVRKKMYAKTIAQAEVEAVAEAEAFVKSEAEDFKELPPSKSFIENEQWETLRVEGRALMTRRVLQGWTVNITQCKGRQCDNATLISLKGKTECTVCGGTGTGLDGAYQAEIIDDEAEGVVPKTCSTDSGIVDESPSKTNTPLENTPMDHDGSEAAPPFGEDVTAENEYAGGSSAQNVSSIPAMSQGLEAGSSQTNVSGMQVETVARSLDYREVIGSPRTTTPRKKTPRHINVDAGPSFDESPVSPTESVTRSVAEMREDFEAKRNHVSKEIGKKMMKGWMLLDMSCPECLMPLLSDPQVGQETCVLCGPTETLPRPKYVPPSDPPTKEEEELAVSAKSKMETEVAQKSSDLTEGSLTKKSTISLQLPASFDASDESALRTLIDLVKKQAAPEGAASVASSRNDNDDASRVSVDPPEVFQQMSVDPPEVFQQMSVDPPDQFEEIQQRGSTAAEMTVDSITMNKDDDSHVLVEEVQQRASETADMEADSDSIPSGKVDALHVTTEVRERGRSIDIIEEEGGVEIMRVRSALGSFDLASPASMTRPPLPVKSPSHEASTIEATNSHHTTHSTCSAPMQTEPSIVATPSHQTAESLHSASTQPTSANKVLASPIVETVMSVETPLQPDTQIFFSDEQSASSHHSKAAELQAASSYKSLTPEEEMEFTKAFNVGHTEEAASPSPRMALPPRPSFHPLTHPASPSMTKRLPSRASRGPPRPEDFGRKPPVSPSVRSSRPPTSSPSPRSANSKAATSSPRVPTIIGSPSAGFERRDNFDENSIGGGSVASQALDSIMKRIEDCKRNLAESDDPEYQASQAALLEKLGAAAVAMKRLEEAS